MTTTIRMWGAQNSQDTATAGVCVRTRVCISKEFQGTRFQLTEDTDLLPLCEEHCAFLELVRLQSNTHRSLIFSL